MLGRAERRSFAVSLLLTDIDHFKKVNDSYGHPTGDEVLRRVAAILKASARKIDIVARYGGEEFAIVLEGTDRAGALPAGRAHPRRRSPQQSFAVGTRGLPGHAVDRRRQLSRRRARKSGDHRPRRPVALRRQARRPQPHRLLRRDRPQAEAGGGQVAARTHSFTDQRPSLFAATHEGERPTPLACDCPPPAMWTYILTGHIL